MRKDQLGIGFLIGIFVCGIIVCAGFAADGIYIKSRGEQIVDYSKFGTFLNVGTEKYEYRIKDKKGLAKAAGEGVYPNTDVFNNLRYKALKQSGKLKKSLWWYVDSNPEIDFFAWAGAAKKIKKKYLKDLEYATDPEYSPGLQLFFVGEALRAAGEYMQAIKAYYAVVIHFPQAPCCSEDASFFWYVGPAALDKIDLICREHPELGIRLDGAYVEIENGDDIDLENDIVTVNPGKFVKPGSSEGEGKEETTSMELSKYSIIESRGKGKVRVVKYENGHWQLLVNKKPYVVQGITYAPTKIGTRADEPGRETKWMFNDDNKNGKADAPYDSWVDKNGNNKRDRKEPIVGDFALMKDMGVNTIRMYHMLSKNEYLAKEFDKKVLRDLYKTYGIRVIMGDLLGAYGIGSGSEGVTDYRNKTQKARMKESVRQMVLDHKDEPYILAWILGNENDMPVGNDGVNYTNTNASEYPKQYAKFLNEICEMIHSLDPNHPVISGNFSLNLVEYYRKHAPSLDIYGLNSYRGKDGFGDIWKQMRRKADFPIIITEYGCDAYSDGKGEDEKAQAGYHKGNWSDITYNLGGGIGQGNSLGAMIFEWLDEWWKAPGNPYDEHASSPQTSLPFPDGWAHEEWFGVTSHGNGSNSPFMRQLREAYFFYKDIWTKKK